MRVAKFAVLMSLCLSGALVSAQDATPTPAPCADPLNTAVQWTLTGTSCALREEVSFVFDVEFPHEIAEQSPFAGSIMQSYLTQERSTFWEMAGQGVTPEFSGYPWTLEIKHEIFHHTPQVVSVLFNVYTYTGGAHSNTYFKTFTFDLENDSLYTLDALFQEGVDARAILAPIAREQLLTTLADFPDFIESGTEPHPDTTTYPGLDNYANWVLTEDALVLYFPPYQVAPYVAGPQTVTIPLADLQDVLNPAFLPAS